MGLMDIVNNILEKVTPEPEAIDPATVDNNKEVKLAKNDAVVLDDEDKKGGDK